MLVSFGTVFGAIKWINSNYEAVPATSGAVMISALPLLVGMQLLISALNYDINSIPRIPICKDD